VIKYKISQKKEKLSVFPKKTKPNSLHHESSSENTMTAADPATVNLFKAASFVDVDGALDGGVEIDDGVIAGVAWGDAAVELAEGEIAGDGAWDGGVETDDGVTAAVGEIVGDGPWDGGVEIHDGATAGAAAGEPEEADGEAEVAGGDATGESAEGEIAGDGNGEDDGGDLATAELSNSSATKSINTAVWEAIVERWRRIGILGLTRKFWVKKILGLDGYLYISLNASSVTNNKPFFN